MKKIYVIIFSLIFIPLTAYCNNTDEWLTYDMQETPQMDLSEDIPSMPVIIGPDDRIEITGIANKYQKPAVTLMIFFSEGEVYCSGALVGKNIVLTAAHCLISNGNLPSGAIIYANGVPERPTAVATRFLISEKYKYNDPNHDRYDYAFILLDSPLGNQVGYFGLKKHSVLRLLKKKIQVLGIGADKSFETLWLAEGHVRPFFLITSPKKYFIEYDADTTESSSGAPVVLADDPGNIIAINNLEFKYYPIRRDNYVNTGLLITSDMERMLNQLRKHYEVSEEINNNVKQFDKEINNQISNTIVNAEVLQ